MFKIFMVLSVLLGLGLLLAFITVAESYLFLFLGLGIVLAATITLYFKKYAYYLYFPLIICFALILYTFNSIDFQANTFHVSFLYDQNHTAQLTYNVVSENNDEKTLEEGKAASGFWVGDLDSISISLEKEPLLQANLLILSDYYSDEYLTKKTWSWSSDEALFLNSPLRFIVIKTDFNASPSEYTVKVNNKAFDFFKVNEQNLYYLAPDSISSIRNVAIVERSSEAIRNIRNLQPGFEKIYYTNSSPDPIVIESIELNRLIGRFNRYLPFYQWDAAAIIDEFKLTGGEAYIDNNLLYIIPNSPSPSLHLKAPPEDIAAIGLKSYQPYILGVNITLIVLMLISFLMVSFLANRSSNYFIKAKNYIQFITSEAAADREIRGLTSFKLFLFTFLLLLYMYVFRLIEPDLIKNLVFAALIINSLILTAYVVRDFWRSAE